MDIPINSDSFFIFDLDDTLYPELDFLESGYRHIAAQLQPHIGEDICDEMLQRYAANENVFQWIIDTWGKRVPGLHMGWLLQQYREHYPDIHLPRASKHFLQQVKEYGIPSGLITDGRSTTQRNKLSALGLEHFFTAVIISEEFGSAKPDPRNYTWFTDKFPGRQFTFFGDNTSKDFIVPARLGWRTICIADNGRNIHRQDIYREPVPDFVVNSFDDISLQAVMV